MIVDHQRGNDRFHQIESLDVYDLYNACNGTLHNGVLDVRKLDELSQEEREVLDVVALKKLWAHVVAGCIECEGIIKTLNFARGVISGRAGEPRSEPSVKAAEAKFAE